MSMPKIDISSIISILLALALAFTSMGGMPANIEDTVSFDVKITVDAEALLAAGQEVTAALPEETRKSIDEKKDIIKIAGDIISVMTLRGTASKDAAEAVLLAGDNTVLSLGMKKDDTGVTVATNLLPSDVIFISNELIQAMQDEMEKQKQQSQELQQMLVEQAAAQGQTASLSATSSLTPQDIGQILEKLDKEQIAKDIEEAGKKLTEGIEAKKGETETGEFTVDGLTFVSKTPINMTYPEFAEFLLTGAKELAAKESLKPLFDAIGKDLGAEIDKAIEELKNQPESDYPEEFDLAVYADADNCTYAVSDMVKQSEAGKEELHIAYGDIEGQGRAKIIRNQGDDRMVISSVGTSGIFDMNATIDSKTSHGEINASLNEAGNLNITCDIIDQEQKAKIVVSTEKAEGDRTNFLFSVSFGDAEKPMLAFSGSFGKGGELVSVFEGEKINATPAEKLMDPDSTESASFGLKLGAGALKTVMVVTKSVPKETAEWISNKIKEAMSPKPETTEAPQEQVVDGD